MGEIMRLSNLTASQDAQAAERIGWITWFYVPQATFDVSTVQAAFASSGLDFRYRFPKIRPADAFRRASKSVEGSVAAGDKNAKWTFMVRDVQQNAEEITRNLVLEVRDELGKRLEYDPHCAEFVFERRNLTVRTLAVRSGTAVEDACQTFETRFATYCHEYDDSAVRRVATTVLSDALSVSLKESGGVYLVPIQSEELLFGLMNLLDGIPGARGFRLAVENSSENRDMMRHAVERDAQVMIKEIRLAMQAENMTDSKLGELVERARRVRAQTLQYKEVLSEASFDLEEDLDLLNKQLKAVLQKI